MPRRAARSRVVRVVVAAVALVAAGVAGAIGPVAHADPVIRPVIFVHGVLGSANQFESQSMRFTSNGYPIDRVVGFDYDSLSIGSTTDEVRARLDQLIADVQASSGSAQVDLVGHSLGTSVLQGYLNSSPERAADVAHYVNLDGATATALPGGVPTLAIWGRGSPTREIVGAENVYHPDQTHTQTVTSPETFEVMYEFLTGAPPATRDIVRQRAGEIHLSGRAHLFPSNAPVEGRTLQIFEVDPATGQRLRATPDASFELTDGSWGPFDPDPSAHYEFAIIHEGVTHHFYFEPFVRSSSLMRLLTAEAGEGFDALWERSPDHSNMVLLRNKEWWGDQGADLDDVLTVDGLDVVTPATAPITKNALASFVWDVGSDKVSNPGTPPPAFAALPFLTGADIYVPAANPPDDVVAVHSVPRLGNGLVVDINIPNWPSDTDRTTIQFNDFTVTQDPPPLPTTTTTSTVTTSTSTSTSTTVVSTTATPVAVAVATEPTFAG